MRLYGRLTIETKQAMHAWLFLAVPIVFFVVIRFYPALESFGIAFTEWNLLSPARFVGFANFHKMWDDPVFWLSFRNTFVYLLIGTPVSLVLSFVVAYYLDQVRFAHGFIRACYFIPHLTSAVAMAWTWRWFYQPPPVGLFNNLLNLAGLGTQPFLRSTVRRCRRCSHPRSGPVLASRSCCSWQGCGPSPPAIMKQPASTERANG